MTEEVTAKITDGPECSVQFEIDETIEKAAAHYGADVVYSRYRASLIIDLQSFLRTQMKKDPMPTQEEIQGAVDAWAPGVKAKGRSTKERAQDILGKLSAEERAELLAEFDLD